MLIPIRKLHNYFNLWIYCFSRANNQVFCCICHQVEAVLCPSPGTLIFYSAIVFTICKKEIIQDYFIKIFCGVFNNVFGSFTVDGVTIAKSLEAVAFVNGKGDASGNLNAPVFEEFFGDIQSMLVNNQKIAMGFKINLIHLKLAGYFIPN